MIREQWANDRLECPVFASLAHAVEVAIPAVDADAGAGRTYEMPGPQANETPYGGVASYVSAGRLGIAQEYEPIIHDWPGDHRSAFARLQHQCLPASPFRPHEVLGHTIPAEQLFGPIEARCRVVDALAMRVNLQSEAWAMLMLFRCGGKPPFDRQQEQRLQRLSHRLAKALHRGCRSPLSGQAGASTTPSMNTQMLSGSPTVAASPLASDIALHPATALEPDTGIVQTLPEAVAPSPEPAEALEAAEPPAHPDEAALLAKLSRTERHVLDHLRDHHTEKQIGERMNRSPHTIHVHVKNIYRKFAVCSRRELMQLFNGHPHPTSP